jgi:hypothetical protein
VVNVEAGKRYRILLVSFSCAVDHISSFGGHRMTITEADGQSTVPGAVVRIFAGAQVIIFLT